jgi:hypothetical protein
MTDAIKYQTLDKFMGINNVDDKTRLVPLVIDRSYVYPLQTASNVDIDNSFAIASRSGYGTSGATGTDIHSIWSDDVTCFFVDGTNLKQLGTGYNAVTVRSGLTAGHRMSFAPWNDRIYYTNGHEIGYVKSGVDHAVTDPASEFKLPLPAGQLIEYYRGCLYVAKEKILYVSDPLCDYFDVRMGYKQFASNITMIRAVDEGLYVGDDRIWWVGGDSPETFERREVYTHRPISFTDVRVNGQDIGGGIKGNVAMWTADNGICLGDNSGTVVNLTEGRYTFTPTVQGAGFIRVNSNQRYYINSLY